MSEEGVVQECRIRVLSSCSQRLVDGGRVIPMRAGEEHDWSSAFPMPSCFERIDGPEADDESDDESAEVYSSTPAVSSLQALSREEQISMASYRLDRDDLDLWTALGLPMVEAVSLELKALGFDPEVKRTDINVACPGFSRES